MSADEPTKSEASTAHEGPHGTPGRPPPDRPSLRPGGAASLIGTTLSGRYKIERLLGEGGMGAVYQAEHTHMRKRLAVKVLHPEMSRLTEVVQRFEREAMAAAHIDHPNVATATDFGKLDDGSFFLVLEFVEGKSLRDAINDGRLELGRTLHILRQISAGLQRAHALGIVHRDLKPENIMLIEREGDQDFVKVLDFGIAKVPVGELARTTGEKGPVLTQMGMVYGTPEYMAPEQALGQDVDPRADIYALGVMTFEMLTGSRPYDHESKVALLGMHVTAPIPLPSERCPDAFVPPEVDAVVRKLLAKEANERFADARELTDAVAGLLGALASVGRVDPKYAAAAGGPQSSQLGQTPGAGAMSARGGSLPQIIAGPGTGMTPAMPLEAPSLPPQKIHIPPRAILAGVAGVLVLAIVFVVVLRSGGGTVPVTLADGAVVAAMPSTGPTTANSTPVVVPPVIRPEIDAQIRAGIALVEKQEFEAGIAQLTDLEKANDDRTDLHRALVDAYIGTKRPADAMDEAARTLALDAGFSHDKNLRIDVRKAALTGGRDAEDKAFEILETGMSYEGPDVLYDIGYIVKEYPKQIARARASLKKQAVRAKASEELKIALEIRTASEKSPCDIHRMLDRAADVGDWRTAQILKGYQAGSGCGFLGRRDCWPCLHGDGALFKAIKAIEERAKENRAAP